MPHIINKTKPFRPLSIPVLSTSFKHKYIIHRFKVEVSAKGKHYQ